MSGPITDKRPSYLANTVIIVVFRLVMEHKPDIHGAMCVVTSALKPDARRSYSVVLWAEC
eukprot:6481862-Amphidinium_carterae.1